MKHLLILSLILTSGSFCFAAEGATAEAPKVIAIQHRNYRLTNELTGYISYLPLDSFTQYFSIGANFTHYFNDYLGWEIANVATANSSSTGLKDYILNNYGAFPQVYDTINYYVTSNAVYTPLYMKNLLFSNGIGYGDISFVGGGGLTKFNAAGNVPTADLGIIIRYFVGTQTSLKFDFRNFFYTSTDLKYNIGITVGLSYNFGTNEDRPVTEEIDE